jgi:hypothetical protein
MGAVSTRQRAQSEEGCTAVLVLVVLVAMLAWAIGSCSANAQTSTETGYIVDTYVKGGESAKYFIVVRKDGSEADEVFENRDVQQVARRLFERNAHVRVQLNGARWTLVSWFRNVLSIAEATP